MGTGAVVVQVTGTNWPKPLYTLLVTGLCRFRIDKIVMEEPYLIAEVTQLDKPAEQGIVQWLVHLYSSISIYEIDITRKYLISMSCSSISQT